MCSEGSNLEDMGLFRNGSFFSSRRRHTRLQGDWSSDVCSSDLAQQLNRKDDAPAHEQLSEREFQVFLKLARGETAGDIAKSLSLSVKTVSTYRTRLMEKMGLSSNSDLTYYALKNRLID